MKIFWRWKDKGGPWMEGWVCTVEAGLIRIGSFNGDPQGIWVKPSEIEQIERFINRTD